LFQFYLSLCDASQLSPGIASGMDSLIRPISSGRQTFKADQSIYPVSEKTPKLSGIYLVSLCVSIICYIIFKFGSLGDFD